MCGIAFFVDYSEDSSHEHRKFKKGLITRAFTSLEDRGTDASGYYTEKLHGKQTKRSLIKATLPSSKLLEYTAYDGECKKHKITGSEKLVILHTRQTTLGDERCCDNNHPIISDKYILVHNGSVVSTPIVAKYDFRGDVDSERIVANIETYGMVEGLRKTSGSLALIFKEIGGDTLYLYRDSNPLVLVNFIERKLFVGISATKHIEHTQIFTDEVFHPSVSLMSLPEEQLFSLSLREPKVEMTHDFSKETKDHTRDYVSGRYGSTRFYDNLNKKWIYNEY